VIVADSSYLAEGLLVDGSLLKSEKFLVPELAVFEAAGAIWKHQTILGRIDDGEPYLTMLFELLKTNVVLTTSPGAELMRGAYFLAVRYGAHPHDTVFVELALKAGLQLKSLDAKQLKIFDSETRRKATG
jgi:predicted nucleic acid-binding protein